MASDLPEQISCLYLSEKCSDVQLIIGDEILPAHRDILCDRCLYFKLMFASGMREAVSGQVVVQETTSTAVKSVLMWIYTGFVNLADCENDIDFLRLAHMYELPEVVKHVVDHLKIISTMNNLCLIFNVAELLSLIDLKVHVMGSWKHDKMLSHETFSLLTTDALTIILKNAVKTVSTIEQLEALVLWMEANMDKKQQFPDLLKIIPIHSIHAIDLALVIPLELIDGNDVLKVVHDQWLRDGIIAEKLATINFSLLTVDDLKNVLQDAGRTVSSIQLIESLVLWMKANMDKKEHFLELLQSMPLDTILAKDLAGIIPSELIDGNGIMKVIRKQWQANISTIEDTNVVLSKHGTRVTFGGKTVFPSTCVLQHNIGSSDDGIFVDLGRRFKLNLFKMCLVDDDSIYSYWIAVSEDNVNYARVIDYSNYACRSLQKLYFMERLVRYIRICGTFPVNSTLEISNFEAFYTTEPFEIDPETTLLIPFDNVALIQKNAVVSAGINYNGKHAIINGKYDVADDAAGFTYHKIDNGGIIVQLPQPYVLDSMKLLLENKDRSYSYYVSVSTDHRTWKQVFYEDRVSNWREIHFDREPVVFIKITGTHSSLNDNVYTADDYFCVVHLECAAVKRTQRKRTFSFITD